MIRQIFKGHKLLLSVMVLPLLGDNSLASAQSPNFTVLEGTCTEQSHIAEGPRGADLTQRHARYFCDSAVVSVDTSTGNVMFQFSDRRSLRQAPIGFAGILDEPNLLTVQRVYIDPGQPLTPREGFCRLFFRGGATRGSVSDIQSIVCGAQVDEDDRRTVPVISFQAR